MNIQTMSRLKLLNKCKELKIKKYSLKSKFELIEMINLHIKSLDDINIPIINNTNNTININNNEYTFIEVCAGGGGLSSGLIKAGFIPLLLNDNNNDCYETLKLNHPNTNIVLGPFEKIDYSQYIDNVDLLTGGTPCPSFSQSGLRKGLDDSRGELMLKFIDIINIIHPKIFMIENVKGLLTHDNGNTIIKIIEIINKNNLYNVSYKCLDSSKYNIPQKRERVFIIGVLKTINIPFNFPEESINRKYLKDILYDVPISNGLKYNDEKIKLFKMIPQGGCWINLPKNLQKKYLGNSYNSGGGKRGILYRLSMEKPSLTLLCTPSQKQTERCHPLEERPLTIREYARIQTFEDSYTFIGSINSQYRQIGNAVPVELAIQMGTSIIDLLLYNTKEIINNNIFDIDKYFKTIDTIIYNILKRPTSNTLIYDILDTNKSIQNKLISLKEKQRQMKVGEIWQEVLGNYNGYINLKNGHESGLDIISYNKKIVIELKNRTNTDNASSKKSNFNKLVKFKINNPEYTCIYGNINDDTKELTLTGSRKVFIYSDVEIEHQVGYKFLKFILEDDVDIIINFVRDTIDKYI